MPQLPSSQGLDIQSYRMGWCHRNQLSLETCRSVFSENISTCSHQREVGHGQKGEIKEASSLIPWHLCLAAARESPVTIACEAPGQPLSPGGGPWACNRWEGCFEGRTPYSHFYPEAQSSLEIVKWSPSYILFYREGIFIFLRGKSRHGTQFLKVEDRKEKAHILLNGYSEIIKWYYQKGKTDTLD